MQDEAKRRGLLCDVCDEAKDTGIDDETDDFYQ